jgi:peptide/nickel transport system permease protein
MFRFIINRVVFIALVSVFIVYSVSMGMRMVDNSEIAEPDFEVVKFGQLAWEDTKEFFSGLPQGDMGVYQESWGPVPVVDKIKETFINSMGLLGITLAFAAIIGFGIGGFIALYRSERLIMPLLILTILGISIPSFFGGFLLQRGVILYKNAFETGFIHEFLIQLKTAVYQGVEWKWQYLLLPVLVLSARPLAYLTRAGFISLKGVMGEDFIRTAYAKGVRRRWVVLDHALRNIAVPMLTAVGVSLRFSLSSLPVIEYMFVWPGMGWALIRGITERQPALVVGLAFTLGLTIQAVNFLLDLLYRIIDPRMREMS